MSDSSRNHVPTHSDRMTSVGWTGAVLSGVALIAVTVMMFVLFGVLDAHYHSLRDIFNPDPSAAAGILGLAGGAEGVTLSIVIVAVMFAINGTSSRYSPRIIGIFTRNALNALVLGFALASILYTFLARSEVTATYVPKLSVAFAMALALLNFAILFPYVGYVFEVMRAETLVAGIMRRAGRELRAAHKGSYNRSKRDALMTSIAQVTDIAFGSIQVGDIPVCVMAIEVLGDFMSRDYLSLKKKLSPDWFKVGHAELPGASDQIIAEVNRAGTWFAYSVMSFFVDMVGLTPLHRKEAVHAIAVATRNIGLAAIDVGDPEVAELCLRFFNTYLRVAINRTAPTFASGIMNEYRRYAIGALEWRPDLAVDSAAHILRYGRHFDEAGMPAIYGAAAEDVADLAIEARARDPEVSRRLARLLVRHLLELMPNARPIGLNGLFKGVAKLTFWAMAADERDVTRVLVEGIAAAPPDFVDAALDRMEGLQNGLFWEVNERVIAFDWVERPLREQIPRLRAALRRAKATGGGLSLDLEAEPVAGAELVHPPDVAPASTARTQALETLELPTSLPTKSQASS